MTNNSDNRNDQITYLHFMVLKNNNLKKKKIRVTNLVLTTHTGFVNINVNTPASAATVMCMRGPKDFCVFPPCTQFFIVL